MRCDRAKRTRGFTLIELLVALSLLAVIMPLTGWTIYLLLRAQTASADSLADAMILSRFATTFRNDVHAAQSADVDAGRTPGPASILLRLDSPRIVSYTAEPNGVVVRTVQKGTLVERREEFRLTGTQTQFERDQKNSTAAAVQRLHAATIAGGSVFSSAASSIRIEAVIGRDRRFERPPRGASTEPPPPSLPTRPGAKEHRS
jgi:prepilin-type N-terminal cleavage/methylation domain-containing protein